MSIDPIVGTIYETGKVHVTTVSTSGQERVMKNIEGQEIAERTTTTQILNEIMHERMAQDEKWGPQVHALPEWASILLEEVGEGAMFINHYSFPGPAQGRKVTIERARRELIQCAAVCVAIIEQIDNGEARVIV